MPGRKTSDKKIISRKKISSKRKTISRKTSDKKTSPRKRFSSKRKTRSRKMNVSYFEDDDELKEQLQKDRNEIKKMNESVSGRSGGGGTVSGRSGGGGTVSGRSGGDESDDFNYMKKPGYRESIEEFNKERRKAIYIYDETERKANRALTKLFLVFFAKCINSLIEKNSEEKISLKGKKVKVAKNMYSSFAVSNCGFDLNTFEKVNNYIYTNSDTKKYCNDSKFWYDWDWQGLYMWVFASDFKF